MNKNLFDIQKNILIFLAIGISGFSAPVFRIFFTKVFTLLISGANFTAGKIFLQPISVRGFLITEKNG